MTAEKLHEETVKRHLEEALKKTQSSAESQILRLQNEQKLREEERAADARRKQDELRALSKPPDYHRQDSMQDYIKQEEKRIVEEQRRREDEWRRREKETWDAEMERRRQERLREEERVNRRREEEERRIRAEIQEKLEADRRKREDTLRSVRKRTPSAHSAHDSHLPVPPSPPPPLVAPQGGMWSSSSATTQRVCVEDCWVFVRFYRCPSLFFNVECFVLQCPATKRRYATLVHPAACFPRA